VIKIVPIKEKKSVQELFGDFLGRITYHEDIDTPTLEEWDNA